jgi:hypothetical protein
VKPPSESAFAPKLLKAKLDELRRFDEQLAEHRRLRQSKAEANCRRLADALRSNARLMRELEQREGSNRLDRKRGG